MQKPVHLQIQQSDDSTDNLIGYAKCLYNCGNFCGCLRTWLPCIFCCCVDYPYKEVQTSTVGMFERFNRYVKTVKAGLHYVNPCTDSLKIVDSKIQVLDLQRQSIMTKDNILISIDAAVYYQISNPRYSLYRVGNIRQAVSEITYSILKNSTGNFILQDLLEKRNDIADDIQKQVGRYVQQWGIVIQNIYMKDIRLNADLEETLSSAAKERRLAQSKLIQAKAEVESAKLMREAADILDSKVAMQIRYLETISLLGKQSSTKVVFLPTEQDKEKFQHRITQGLIN